MAEYDEPAPEANATLDGAATATADGRSPPSKRGHGRSPQHDAQPHGERSSKSRGRDREPDEDRDTERHRRRRTDGERYLDRESGRDRGDRSRDRDRDRHHHHREHRERSERREHRDRSDDRSYRPSRDRDAERGDCDRDGHRRHRSHSRSESQSKRVSGFDQGPSEAIHMAALPAVPAPIPGMLPNMPNMLPNMYNLPNLGQPQHMTQQATRHARRVYVDGLSPSANEETVAIFFNQVMATIGGNTVGVGDAVVNVYINHDKKFAFVEMRSVEEASNAMALDGITFDGAPVKVRRPTDYNPSQAALLGPSQPNPNLNLAAVGLTPGLGGGLEGPDRIFVGGLPYYLTEDQVRELLETFGPQLDVLEPIETVAICYGVLRLLDKAGNTVEAVDTFLQHNLYPPLVNCLIQGDTEVTTLVFYAIKLLAEIPKGIDVIFPPDCQGSIQLEKVAAQSSSGLAEHRHRNIFFLLKTSLLAHISDVINDPSIDSDVRSRASSVSRRLNSSSDVFMTTEKCCMEAEYACCMSINKAWASSHLHESNLSEIVGKVEEFTKTNLEFILWRIVFDPDYTPPNNIHKVNQYKLRDFEDIMSYATPDVAYFLYHQPVQNITRSIGNKSGERWRQISLPSLGTICTITKFKFYKDGKKQNGRMEEFLLQVRNKEDTENLVLCRVYVTEQSADTILRAGPQPLPLLSRLHEEVGVETLQKEEEHLQEMTVQWTAKISQLEEELKAAREVASKAMERCDKQNEIIQHLNRRLIEVNHQIVEGDNLRKKQHDRILVLKGNLRVFVRVKPLQKENNSNGMQIEPIIACTTLKESPDYTIRVNGKVYAFDKVFDHKASQEDVFVEMAELVESVLDGENVSIFTYGQTGSGKTYTMIGELGDQAGIIPRALKQILIAKESKEKAGWRISLKVSVLEFYNDESKDLLGESVNIVNSDSDVAYYVQLVKTNRSIATTNMNKASSRSHLVFSLHVSQSNEDTKVESTINLIDLAGSERLPKSGSEGEQKKEAMAINVSLTALGRVLAAIARKESHIPWRDSKLMYYLKPCLEENSKKVMLVNVSSEEEQMSETTSSLVFASLVNRTDVVPAPGGKHKCGKNKNMFSPPCGKSKSALHKPKAQSALHKRKAPFLSPALSRKTCVRN